MEKKLGTVRKDYKENTVSGETIFLSEHNWDCDWYWGFGYVGNGRLHTHFDSTFLSTEADVNKIFSETKINQDTWWLLRDLFIQAYALSKSAETYRYGGHQTTKKGVTDIIQDKKMCIRLNKDLKTVLDKIWSLI